MYRPSKYTQHNDTLEIFSNIFNNCKKHRELQIIDFLKENFSDDGKIVNLKSNKEIIFDWEVRYKYFSNGDFAFETLGQFERKFNKTPPVDLSIQSDKQKSEETIYTRPQSIKQNPAKFSAELNATPCNGSW